MLLGILERELAMPKATCMQPKALDHSSNYATTKK